MHSLQNLCVLVTVLLMTPTDCAAKPTIIIDPLLTKATDGGLMLTGGEGQQLIAQVEKSLKLAREILSRPQAKQYFKSRYKLDPIEMIDRDGWSISITAFHDKPNERPGEVECIGMYYTGEGRMAVDIRRVMLGPGYGLHETGTADVARTIVHEVAHWADDLKGGPTNNDRAYDREEGVLAERACGCGDQTALRHHPWQEELAAWRREAAQRRKPHRKRGAGVGRTRHTAVTVWLRGPELGARTANTRSEQVADELLVVLRAVVPARSVCQPQHAALATGDGGARPGQVQPPAPGTAAGADPGCAASTKPGAMPREADTYNGTLAGDPDVEVYVWVARPRAQVARDRHRDAGEIGHEQPHPRASRNRIGRPGRTGRDRRPGCASTWP